MRDGIPLALLGALPFALGSSAYAIDCSDVTGGAGNPSVCNEAASLSKADIFAAELPLGEGGTVILPAGEGHFTEQYLIWYHSVSFIGQTTVDAAAGTANDQTIIYDDSPHEEIIFVASIADKSYRVSGITLRDGSRGSRLSNSLTVLGGYSHSVRMDHCHFDDVAGRNYLITTEQAMYGVVDHCLFDSRTNSDYHSINVTHDNWGNPDRSADATWYGNGSFADPAFWGSEKFLFVEDCNFNNTSPNIYGGTFEGSEGGRLVLRHTILRNTAVISHGNDGGAPRGMRATEVYDNDFYWTMAQPPGGFRTGSTLWHDNRHHGLNPGGVSLENFRPTLTVDDWGAATGDNPWDINVTESDGVTHVEGHSPYLFDSGTASFASVVGGDQGTITDSSKNWTPDNKWVGYTAKKLSTGEPLFITGSTATTLTGIAAGHYASSGGTWTTGDAYQIHKCLTAIDQPGLGAGELVTDSDSHTFVNSVSGGASWVHAASEPCYIWNDVYDPSGANVPMQFSIPPSNSVVLQEGRDFYNGTPLPGYTPYTYPHPLVTGATPTPTPAPTLYLMLH